MYTERLEYSVVSDILLQLDNLGWNVDERNPECNVFQGRAKLEKQKETLQGKRPDFILYKENSNQPIAVIEAKKPNQSVRKALQQARELYATPLNIPLIFAYNGSYIETEYTHNGRSLKIDGEDVRQFVNPVTAYRFVNEGSEILSAVTTVQHSRDELIKIFKNAANLLREDGLQAGFDRFSAFSDILFLKILDEMDTLKLSSGEKSANTLDEYLRWSNFCSKTGDELYNYVRDVVWKKINQKYERIFSDSFPINSPDIFEEIVKHLSGLNLTASDSDVNGDAFEYFLKNAYQGITIKDLGEYFTPRNIVRMMISMIAPKIGETVYDPFCGTGGFLIEAFKYLKIRSSFNDEVKEILQKRTVYGSEITANARVAKMNMILFGDGHSNIIRRDTLSNCVAQKYDIVVTNPPYSQKTRHGHLYPIQSKNGDAMCALHCFESLKKGGRGCLLLKEDFFSTEGDVGKVREYIFQNSSNVSVVSLPRRLFEPYTPTKTSILYFEKSNKESSVYLFAIDNVGHELGSRKKAIKENDIPIVLDAFNNKKIVPEIDSISVQRQDVVSNKNSLFIYDYCNVFKRLSGEIVKLGDCIEEVKDNIKPSLYPEEEFRMLGVSNNAGVFEGEVLMGGEIKQKYKRVKENFLVYNPHRINVGSLGLVPKEMSEGYVSNIYVVFKVKDEYRSVISEEYLLRLLKSEYYLRIIRKYDAKYGAVRANLNYKQLCNIKIPLLTGDSLKIFYKNIEAEERIKNEYEEVKDEVKKSISALLPEMY